MSKLLHMTLKKAMTKFCTEHMITKPQYIHVSFLWCDGCP